MHIRKALVVSLTCSTLIGLNGCKKAQEMIGAAAQTAQSAAAQAQGPSSEEEKDDTTANKLSGYIDCLNNVSRFINRSKSSYLDDVDAAKGPTGKESSVYVQTVSIDGCSASLDKAKTEKPPLPEVEASAETYRAAIRELEPLLKSAHDYYDHKDYEDDKWAKAKSMHGPLMAAFSKFDAANKDFESKVTTLNEEIGARRLERLSKKPERKLEYLTEKTVADAKKLVKLADAEKVAALDGTAFSAALDAYEKTYTELDQYQSSHKEEVDKVSTYSMFVSSANDYLKATKELMRRKRDNKEFDNSAGSLEHRSGHPANVVYEFNDLIQSSNRLTFQY